MTSAGVFQLGYERWFVRLIEKLLEADPRTLALLRHDPFSGRRPRSIRAQFYLYRFATREEHARTGDVWKRTLVGEYLHLYWMVSEHVLADGDERSAKKMWELIREKGPPDAPETLFAKARLDPTRTEVEKLWD